MHRPLAALLALAAALLASCGAEVGDRPSPQPPRWRSVSPSSLVDTWGFALEARSPTRVVFRHGVEGGKTEILKDMTLAAGEVVVAGWGQEAVRVDPSTRAPAEEAAAGRPEGWVVHQRFSLQSTPILVRTATVWTRPGLGRPLLRAAAAPGIAEEVPFGSSLELGAVAIADVASGEASLGAGPGRSRLRMPSPADGGDRGTLVRLWMEVIAP